MTVDEGRRRNSGENSQIAIDRIDATCQALLTDLQHFQEMSYNSARLLNEESKVQEEELVNLRREYAELSAALKLKTEEEVRELSVVYEAQYGDDMDRLFKEHIAIPKSKLKKYWNQLGIRLEPALNGVTTVLGFHPSLGLADLRFVVQSVGESFSVTDCDPMIIGLSELVDRLNSDTRSGSLARFCCRIRSTYTAQYSTN